MSDSFVTPWTVAHQAPLSMGFPRQEYCIGLPFPSPGGLPDPRVKLKSLASPALAGEFFTTVQPEYYSAIKWNKTVPFAETRRDWGQEEKETTKDEMAGWHH